MFAEPDAARALVSRVRQAGGSCLVTIAGPAGAGKTRVLEEIRAWVGLEGITACVGLARGGAPYEPFRMIVRQAADHARTACPDVSSRLAAGIAPLLETDEDLGLNLDPWVARARLHSAIGTLLGELAATLGGLAIALDSWECADDGSLRLLDDLMRQLAGDPIFWLVASREFRAESISDRHQHIDLPGEELEVSVLKESVLKRLSRLDPVSHKAAEYAALLGRPFRPRVLARAMGIEDGLLGMCTEELRAARLLRVWDDRLVFDPGGLPDLVAARIAPDTRAGMHRALALAIEAEGAPLSPEDLEALADQAHAAGLVDLAITSGLLSARRHLKLFAATAARSRASTLATYADEGSQIDRLGIQMTLADALRLAGEPRAALEPYSRAQIIAQRSGRKSDQAYVLIGIAKALLGMASIDESLEVLEEAISVAALARDGANRSRALQIRARILYSQGHRDAALVACQDAVTASAGARDDLGSCAALAFLGHLLAQRSGGERTRGLDTLVDAIHRSEDLGDTFTLGQALSYLCEAQLAQGDHAQAEATLTRLETLARQSSEPPDRLEDLRAAMDEAVRSHVPESNEGVPSALPAAMPPGPPPSGAPDFRVALLAAFAQELVGIADTEALQERVLDLTMQIAQADRGLMLFLEDGELKAQVTRGAEQNEDWSYSATIAEQVLWSGEPLFVFDALSDPRLSLKQSVAALSLHTVVCVPFATNEQTLGVIYLDRRSINNAFTTADLEVVTALASQTAQALVSVRHIRDLERKNKELEALVSDIAQELRGALDTSPPGSDRLDRAALERIAALLGQIGR